MNSRLARWITRIYPPAWRERYGEEFQTLLESSPGDLKTIANSLTSALSERIFPTQGATMHQSPDSFATLIKRPSAFLPVAMSLACLAMMLVAILSSLIAHDPIHHEHDEGPLAHIFQLLMTLQMPIALFFAVKWIRRAPAQSLGVLAVQAGAWLAACAPVYFLHL